MSRALARRRARVVALGRDFLHPLLAGGTMEVGVPVGPSFLDDWELLEHLDDQTFEETRGLVVAAALTVAPTGVVPWPERGAFALTLAAYDLLALTDPAFAQGVFAGRAARRVRRWIDRFVETTGRPATRGEALVRHAVVERLLAVRRPETAVETWAARYRFAGRPVPPRLLALPRLRAVRTEESIRPLVELVDRPRGGRRPRGRRKRASSDGPLRGIFQRILRASPLTAVLHPELAAAPLVDPGVLLVLSDDRIRAGVARRLATADVGVRDALGEHLADMGGVPRSQRWPVWALVHELAACEGERRGPVVEASTHLAGLPAGASGAQLLDALAASLVLEGPSHLPERLRRLGPEDEQALRHRANMLLERTPAAATARGRALLFR